VLDFLAISVGAMVGANLRYWMSRSAVRWLGPIFPYGTLTINVLGSFVLGFFLVWASEPALALADRGGLLRRVHHVFQLRL
jgi:fluoride ion exporter CrcB/FEX